MAANEILPLRRVGELLERIPGNPDSRPRPSIPRKTQAERLGPELERAFTRILDRSDISVADDPTALAPDRALVLEVIGSPREFINAAKNVGLEWLAEEVAVLHGVREYFDPSGVEADDDVEDDDEGAQGDDLDFLLSDDESSQSDTVGTLYLGMPTIATFERLRDLWERYSTGGDRPDKMSAWWDLFAHLHKVRPWGPEDRIGEATRKRLANERQKTDAPLNVEVDLWYRVDPLVRAGAVKAFYELVESVGGLIIDEFELEEVRVHSVLVNVPGDVADAIIERKGALAVNDNVMSIRPQSSFRFGVDEISAEPRGSDEAPQGTEFAPSIGALIDGWPVENHRLLRDRLDVIPLDVADSLAPSNARFHGTAMASLILRGDLAENNPPVGRRLKVVPILVPDATGEAPPQNKLALGLIYRAVKELKEGSSSLSPSGQDVVIINHSICDEAIGFAGIVSPWARLLDYLSWQYKVLFVVSAGNVRDTFELPGFATGHAMRTAEVEERRSAILRAIDAAKAQRTMFTPAESVNALTVAAAHRDGSTQQLPANLTDPFGRFAAPNLMSGLGHGFSRSVKPDVMFPGGRQVAHPTEGPTLRVHGKEHPAAYGLRTACPDPYGGDTSLTRLSSGTSNAAALATRAGLLIGDVLDQSPLGAEPWYRRTTAACVLKALIAHGAAWREVGSEMAEMHISAPSKARRKEAVCRSLGYGEIELARVIGGGRNRVTLLGQDEIRREKRHQWEIPLPDELSSSAEFRRIVVTLAWLTPVTANSLKYRTFGLELVGDGGKSKLWDGVARIGSQPPISFAKRGTLVHAIYEGKSKAVPFDENGRFVINVQAAPGRGFPRTAVPYALAVTIEVADTIDADISQSIRRRVLPQVRSTPR